MHRFVKLASRYTRVYYYQNSYVGRYSHTYYPKDKPYGTVHHDDLLYLFVAPGVAPMFTAEDPENLTVERMTRFWTRFADKGYAPLQSCVQTEFMLNIILQNEIEIRMTQMTNTLQVKFIGNR